MRGRGRRSPGKLLAAFIVAGAGLGLLALLAFAYWEPPRPQGIALDIAPVRGALPPDRLEPGEEVADQTDRSAALPNSLGMSTTGATLRTVEGRGPQFGRLPTKQVSDLPAQPAARWTPTAIPSPTAPPLPTPGPTFVADLSASTLLQPLGIAPREKWIDVSLERQQLVAYEGRTPVFDTLISSGTANHPTVAGQFRIWLRFRSQDMDGRRLGYSYHLKNVPFVQYFFEDYALHGTYWHSNFGHPMSHGCVNLPTPAAEWLFNWADYGILVNVHQ